ncbi:MAG: HAMP domain-containing histidine kinase [Acidobacteria bacterium]|nr:HAMP domain-containing histidine kinase [Acidobacteriota bacterium]
MIRPRSLKSRLSWWFAAALLALYGATSTLGWLYARTTARQYALLALKSEAEMLAAYVGTTGRLDSPEFSHAESEPIPLWMRAVREGQVVAASPGAPAVPPLPGPGAETLSTGTFRARGTTFMLVRHRVGGEHADMTIEAVGSLAPLLGRERRLGISLLLVAMLLIPLAALGGSWLAGRALRPLENLVGAIRRIDPAAPGARIDAPGQAVQEIRVLAAAFNDLLARLEVTLEAMRRFTADASHEIRNPLTVLRSGLEIALRRERSVEQYRTLIRENLQEIERLHSVLEGLLAMTRGGPGQYPLRDETADLSDIVRKTVAGFATIAAERGVLLRERVDDGVLVRGDGSLLRLVVFNLVDNAMKHGPDGEPIEVTLSGSDAGATLVVADRGRGVSDEARARLFQRFGRPADDGVGGLGLSVVRWATELHGGSVRLLDSAQGARFEVTLPRQGEVARAPAAPDPAP